VHDYIDALYAFRVVELREVQEMHMHMAMITDWGY
jgi:hypothetical protein